MINTNDNNGGAKTLDMEADALAWAKDWMNYAGQDPWHLRGMPVKVDSVKLYHLCRIATAKAPTETKGSEVCGVCGSKAPSPHGVCPECHDYSNCTECKPKAPAAETAREEKLREAAQKAVDWWKELEQRRGYTSKEPVMQALVAALAAAPKPCEPDHGTKPEAPTELCKVCGQTKEFHLNRDFAGQPTGHPFTPAPKEQRP